MSLTIIEKILLAAHKLEESQKTPFTAEDLIVKAWEVDKGTFGLQGYAEKYPDANRILTNIMGSKGLKGKGWIERVGEKKYTLTVSGSRAAENLLSGRQVSVTRAGNLTRAQLDVLNRLLDSEAFKNRQDKSEDAIIFRDACKFWGISSYSTASLLRNRLTEIRDVLDALDDALSKPGISEIVLPLMKIHLKKETVNSLREVHINLQQKFFDELEMIRKRDDDRKFS